MDNPDLVARAEDAGAAMAAPDPATRSRELGPFGTLLRFPLPLASSVLIALAAILGAPIWGFRREPLLLQIVLATAIGWFFASLLFALIAEARQWGRWAGIGLGLLSLPVLLPFVAFETLTYESLPYPGVAMFGASLALLSILTPARAKGAGPDAVMPFVGALLRRLIAGIPLAIGLAVSVLALAIFLLIASFSGRLWLEFAKVLLCIASPVWLWWYLAGLPGVGPGAAPPRARDRRTGATRVRLGLLCVVSLYGLAAADLATGWTVEWAAVGLAAFAILVWWTADRRKTHDFALGDAFVRHAPAAIALPLCTMAAVSVAADSHPAVTAGDYLVVLLGLWTAGLSIAVLLRPGGLRIAAPMTLAILLAAGSFGPWGLWQVTTRSRLAELERLLAGAGLVVDGHRTEPDPANVDDGVRLKGERILRELYDSGRGIAASDWIESIQPPRVPSDDPEIAAFDRYVDSLHRYPTWRAAKRGVGLADIAIPAVRAPESAPAARSDDGRIDILAPDGFRDRILQVSGYAVVTEVSFPDGEAGPQAIVDRRGNSYRIDRVTDGGVISVTTPDGHRGTLDLVSLIRANPDDRVFETRAGPLRVKFVLDSIEAERSADGQDRMTRLAGLLAVGREDGQ